MEGKVTLLGGRDLTVSRRFCASYSLCQIILTWIDLSKLSLCISVESSSTSRSLGLQRQLCLLVRGPFGQPDRLAKEFCEVTRLFILSPHCLHRPLLQQWQYTHVQFTVTTSTVRSPDPSVFYHFSTLFSLFSILNQLYVKKFPPWVFCLSVLGWHSGSLGSPYIIHLASHPTLFVCVPILYFSHCSGKILIPEWRKV